MPRLVFLFLLCIIACKTDPASKTATNKQPTATPVSVNEDDLIARLAGGLIANPSTQGEQEQNTIANYAIDQLWDVQSTSSGLFYQLIDTGEGELLQWGDRVEAQYEGRFLDGKIFDSSYQRNSPIQFYIGNMIDGWNEGLQLLRPGGRIRLLIPSAQAYQERGFVLPTGETLVPPNTILIFDVHVLRKL